MIVSGGRVTTRTEGAARQAGAARMRATRAPWRCRVDRRDLPLAERELCAVGRPAPVDDALDGERFRPEPLLAQLERGDPRVGRRRRLRLPRVGRDRRPGDEEDEDGRDERVEAGDVVSHRTASRRARRPRPSARPRARRLAVDRHDVRRRPDVGGTAVQARAALTCGSAAGRAAAGRLLRERFREASPPSGRALRLRAGDLRARDVAALVPPPSGRGGRSCVAATIPEIAASADRQRDRECVLSASSRAPFDSIAADRRAAAVSPGERAARPCQAFGKGSEKPGCPVGGPLRP